MKVNLLFFIDFYIVNVRGTYYTITEREILSQNIIQLVRGYEKPIYTTMA